MRITRDTSAPWLCVDCGEAIADTRRAVLLDNDEAVHVRCAVRVLDVPDGPDGPSDLSRRLLDGIR